MKITIATVCYQAVTTIEATILSVLGQTYKDIEYLLMDGNSTDGTIDILKKFGDRIRWFSESDNGIYDAMNKALDKATGDFILFLGADDVLYSPTVIEQVIQRIKSEDAVYYGNVIFRPSGEKYNGRYNGFKLALMNICHQAIFYPRSIYIRKKYDLHYRIYADYAYNLTLYGENIRFVYLPLVISYFNTEGRSHDKLDKAFWNHYKTLVKRNLGFGPYMLIVLYGIYKKYKCYKTKEYDIQ